MASSASTTASSRPDLRSSVSTRLRRGSTVGWLRIVTIVILDAVLLSAARHLAEVYGTYASSPWNTLEHPLAMLPIVATEVGFIAAGGLYEPGEKRRDYLGITKAIVLAQVMLMLIAFFLQPGEFIARSTFILSLMLSILFTCTGRFAVDTVIESLRSRGAIRYPVFLITETGNREKAVSLLEYENRYNILGVADARSLDWVNRDNTLAKIRELGVAEVFISWDAIKNRMFLCWHFQTAGIILHILPVGSGPMIRKPEFWMIGGLPSLTFPPPLLAGSDFWMKRIFDFCSALLILLFAAPIYLLIAIAIKFDSPGPIFYKQTRIGLHGRRFKAWKFRTMVSNADKLQKELEAKNEMKDGVLFKMKNDPRITRVGGFLRRYSLDELPQVFNVLFGQMSLVGPRPLPVRDVEKFSEYHFIRHEVLPGITGLWQVSGRSDITSFDEAVSLDITYIENWSLGLDLKILLQTVKVVLQKKGAY